MTPKETVRSGKEFQQQYIIEEDTISIIDILLILARHLKVIIVISMIFSCIAIIYGFYFVEPEYISTATFMSSGSGDNKSQMMGLAAQIGIAMPMGGSSPKWSYEEVIKSRTMAKSLLKWRFDTEEFGPQKELLQILTYGNEKPGVGIDRLITDGIDVVQGMIEVAKSISLFELEISASESQLAADIANAVMAELDEHQRDYNARKTTGTRKFIEERLLDTELDLEKSEEALKSFRERNRSIIESPQLQLEQERLGRDVAVLIGVFTTLKQQLETAKIEEVKESDYVVILDAPDVPLLRSKPQRKRMAIIAATLGVIVGILFAFIGEYIRNSSDEEKEKMDRVKSLIVNSLFIWR